MSITGRFIATLALAAAFLGAAIANAVLAVAEG